MSSIQEVVDLINLFYSPNPPKNVNEIQQGLQAIQKSPDGLLMAVNLLENTSYGTNVNYFGALTLTVQLSVTPDNFSSTFWEIYKMNLKYLTVYSFRYTNDPKAKNTLFIIKKLMSNLSSIFTRVNEAQKGIELDASDGKFYLTHWNDPLSTFIYMMSSYNVNPDVQSVLNGADNPQLDQLVNEAAAYSAPYNELVNFASSSQPLNQLLLSFTEVIMEDLTKMQSKKHSLNQIHEVVHSHLYITTMALLGLNLTVSKFEDPQKLRMISETVFECTTAWVNYVSMTRNLGSHGTLDLSGIFEKLIDLLTKSNTQTDDFVVAGKVLDILNVVFSNDPTLMDHELRQKVELIFLGVSRAAITSTEPPKNTWMLEYMNYLVNNEMTSELRELASCIVNFLQIYTLDISQKLFVNSSSQNSSSVQEYMSILIQFTNFPLVPILQEYFSVRMVDFWQDLSDSYVDLPNEAMAPNANQIAVDIFQQVVNIYLPKVSFLNKQRIANSDDTDHSMLREFDDFRTSVSDLVSSVWSILGNENLTNVLIEGIGSCDVGTVAMGDRMTSFFQVESMAFFLIGLLIDANLSESLWFMNIMAKSPFFVNNIVALFQYALQYPPDNRAAILMKIDLGRTATTLLSTISGHFRHDEPHLRMSIEALLGGLELCSRDTKVTRNGSTDNGLSEKFELMIIKAISLLCDNCRKQLSHIYLDTFINKLTAALQPSSNFSDFTREKLMRCVGYLLECRTDNGPEEQGRYILQIFETIEGLVNQALTPTPSKENKDYIHSLLSCLNELGSPLIDSKDEENESLLQQLPAFTEFWKVDPLQCRKKILDLLQRILSYPPYVKDPSLIEISCLLLGNGLSSPPDEPALLRFQMQDIVSFVLSYIGVCDLNLSFSFFVYLLEKLIIYEKDNITPESFDYLFQQVFLTYYEGVIRTDPDSLQAMVNFVITVLDSSPSLCINSSQWMGFILPTFMNLLPSHERFTVVSATKFWTKVINNRKYSQHDLAVTRQQLLEIGCELVYHTMYGLYHTQRSDLYCYTDLIRTLVGKFPVEMKKWLGIVLPQLCDKPQTHERFINKLMVTRGSRAAGNVILNWWLECTELPLY